jgi:hypothetical protein
MSIEDLKEMLRKGKDDPDSIKPDRDNIDELLLGVIKIEKRHLYGLDKTDDKKRRENIQKYLDESLKRRES